MKRKYWLFSGMLVLLGLIGSGPGVAPVLGDGHGKYNVPKAPEKFLAMKNPNTSEEDIKKGQRYYKSKCSECHGEEGEGDPDDEEAVAFQNKDYMKTRSDGQLFYIAMYGAGKDSAMEAYGPESDAGMKEERIWQIIAYIRTLAK